MRTMDEMILKSQNLKFYLKAIATQVYIPQTRPYTRPSTHSHKLQRYTPYR
jgi:hypothetical protein